MPSQNTIIPISGKMGDRIYYYRKDRKNRKKYYVRQAPATVTQTTATKKTAADFGTASKASSLIRRGINEYNSLCYDNQLHYNLNKKMGEIVRADVSRPAGQRVVTAANMQFLKGFRFNSAAGIQINPVIEQTATGMTISFPDALRNTTTTHISIKAIALSVNFTKNTAQQVESNKLIIKRNEKCAPLTLNINRRNITLIILEIQSFYEVNGQLYASQNKLGNALDIIAVLPPVEETKEKSRYRNKAPHFWLPYATPATRNMIILPVNTNSRHPHPPPNQSPGKIAGQ